MKHCDGCNSCNIDDKLMAIGKKYANNPNSIIEALHEVQDTYGYVSSTAQKFLSKELNVPVSEIYGIITFYSRFSLVPKGKYNIQVCMGTACYVKGSENILNAFTEELGITEGQTTKDGLFSLESVRCIGACGLSPAVSINSDVYGKMDTSKVREIIKKYRDLG